MHNSYELFSGYVGTGLEILPDLKYALTYVQMFANLLESPYRTNCKSYQTIDYISRTDCLRKCQIRESQLKYGSVSMDVQVFSWEVPVVFANLSNGQNIPETEKTDKYCQKMCPNFDCIQRYYRAVKESATGDQVKGHTLIDIYSPTEPETIFIHRPRLVLFEFLCYMASTLSIWFGFSMVSILDVLEIIVKPFKAMKNVSQSQVKHS